MADLPLVAAEDGGIAKAPRIRAWDIAKRQETLDHALDRICELIAQGRDPGKEFKSLWRMLRPGPPKRATVERNKRPIEEGGLGWTVEMLVEEVLPVARPVAYLTMLYLRRVREAAASHDQGQIDRGEVENALKALDAALVATREPADPARLEAFLEEMRTVADRLPARILRLGREATILETAIRLVRLGGRAREDRNDGAELTVGDPAARIWDRAARIGTWQLRAFAPLVWTAESLWERTREDALQNLRSMIPPTDALPEGLTGNLGPYLQPGARASLDRALDLDELDRVPTDAIERSVTGYSQLLAEIVYARVREARSAGSRQSIVVILADALASLQQGGGGSSTRRQAGGDHSVPMPARLKNLAQIVGAAAQAELDAVKPASRDHAQDDRDRAFNRAVELLQWFEASCTRPERQSAGRTESVVALVSALASAARSARNVEDVFLTEAARLWLAADAGPHRSTAAVQQFGTEIARQVSTRTSSDPPGTRHTGRPLAQELLLAVVRARQPGRDHQDQQSLSSLLVEEVNSEIRAALAADGDSARLDFFPVHLLREPIGCLGTPLEQVERSVLGTGDRSREWGLKWYATLLDLQAAPWFPALLPRQRAIITEVLAARGLPYGAEDWREWLTGEPAFQAIPMDAAVRELVSLVDDLERAFSRGAILGAHDARGLLQSSRRLLELQLWVDPKQRPAITPREPASLEMRDQRYWILLLQELQTGGLTLEWGRDGWRVFRHLTPEFEAVRLLPGHPPGGITMRVDATDGQRSEHVLPLLGISADQLVDVLSHLAHRTRASER